MTDTSTPGPGDYEVKPILLQNVARFRHRTLQVTQ